MRTTTTNTNRTHIRTGAMTTTSRRGKASTATSVLLLCAAVLLTQSWGALAFSAIVRPEVEVAQADALIDITTTTTTVAEGSGWDTTIVTTTDDQEQTTEGRTEAEPATTEAPLAPEESTEGSADATTDAPAEETTTDQPEIATTTASNDIPEEDSTSVAGESSSSTAAGSDTTPAATEQSTDVTTSAIIGSSTVPSTSAPVPETTTPEPTFECQTAGLFPHISGDCSRYHNCLLNVPPLSGLHKQESVCPALTVFSPVYGRCVRDLSSCQSDAFECLAVGRFAGSDDTYYYNCLPSLLGGFHKFIVRCSTGQRFEAIIGGCWRYDWTQLVPGQEALEPSDLAAIKQELKLYKAEDKLRKKALKNQEKLARKQQKLQEKAAKKAAKEEAKQKAKAEKELAKQQEAPSAESDESA